MVRSMPAASRDTPLQRRLLGKDHLRFYRAVMDGVEPRKAWSLYLPLEDEFSEAEARSVLAWTRQSLLAQAVAQGAQDLVGLLRRDPRGVRVPRAPTLEQFAARFEHAGEFSEQELLALWHAEHGGPQPAAARRNRLAARLREAIGRLEGALQRLPSAADPVELWLAPSLASRLVDAGLPTLGALRHSLDQRRATRWPAVPGVGAVWADRLQTWLVDQGITAHPERSDVAELLPLERLPALAHEPPPSPARPLPADDRDCIGAWLQARATNTHTQRLYRRAAERLLLWCRLERRMPLLALGSTDALHYRQWLLSLGRLEPDRWAAAGWHLPAQAWILAGARKGLRRDSPDWRPFDGPLSEASARQDLAILRAMFAHFQQLGWVAIQPFGGITAVSRKVSISSAAAGSARHRPSRADPGLDPQAWSWLLGQVQDPGDERGLRLRVLLWLLGPCGLRPAEALALRLADLRPMEHDGLGWALHIPEAAGRARELPLPPAAARAVLDYLQRLGADADPGSAPLLRGQRGKRRTGRDAPRSALGYSSLQADLQRHLLLCADAAMATQPELAGRLRQASARWLREACAAWSLREGEDLIALQHRLGHASLVSTGKLLLPK